MRTFGGTCGGLDVGGASWHRAPFSQAPAARGAPPEPGGRVSRRHDRLAHSGPRPGAAPRRPRRRGARTRRDPRGTAPRRPRRARRRALRRAARGGRTAPRAPAGRAPRPGRRRDHRPSRRARPAPGRGCGDRSARARVAARRGGRPALRARELGHLDAPRRAAPPLPRRDPHARGVGDAAPLHRSRGHDRAGVGGRRRQPRPPARPRSGRDSPTGARCTPSTARASGAGRR